MFVNKIIVCLLSVTGNYLHVNWITQCSVSITGNYVYMNWTTVVGELFMCGKGSEIERSSSTTTIIATILYKDNFGTESSNDGKRLRKHNYWLGSVYPSVMIVITDSSLRFERVRHQPHTRFTRAICLVA